MPCASPRVAFPSRIIYLFACAVPLYLPPLPFLLRQRRRSATSTLDLHLSTDLCILSTLASHSFPSSCLPSSPVPRRRLPTALFRNAAVFKHPSHTTSTRHRPNRRRLMQPPYRTITTPLPRSRRVLWYPPRCRHRSFQSECGSANLSPTGTRPSWL